MERERDFFAINAKAQSESPPAREEGRASRPNSAAYGNLALQWPFTNREPSQHFLSFTTPQEGQLNHFSHSAFQSIPTPWRELVLDTNQLHKSQSTAPYLGEARVPYVNQRPSGCASSASASRTGPFVGFYQAREVPKPSSSQLTIFYRGTVSVFEDVPLDKAQEIMSLANRLSTTPASPTPILEQSIKPIPKSASFSGGVVINSSLTPTQKPDQILDTLPPPPSVSTQISLAPQGPAGSPSKSAAINESLTTRPHSAAPITTPALVSTSAPNVSRAIPQARKASLARFLEKRKERVIAAVPYPSTAKSPEDHSAKSSSTDLTLSSNRDESLRAGPTKVNNSSEEYPSTRLEI